MKHLYERGVAMSTRDGVTLRANVWRPLEGQAPTLLMRTPTTRRPLGSAAGPVTPSRPCWRS